MKRIILGITGASGSIYAAGLIKELSERGVETHVICTERGAEVFQYEMGLGLKDFTGRLESKPVIHSNSDLFAGPASGSFGAEAMVIVPCSMASLGGIASGSLQSLLGRAADVCLKEKRKLIAVPRETPLSKIHLENMLRLSSAGAVIMPAMPAFYNRPETVEDMVNFILSRILDQLDIPNDLTERWTGG
jgi:4-hydroxy-3-polyprenylbenzoate decarboxylase